MPLHLSMPGAEDIIKYDKADGLTDDIPRAAEFWA